MTRCSCYCFRLPGCGKCLFGTFYNLLGVVGEELAERRPLGPLQRVEQLLDLGGHSAVDRNSYKDEEHAYSYAHASLWLEHTVTKRRTFKLLTILQSAALHPITQEAVKF